VGRAEILMGKLNALRCLDHHHAVLCWAFVLGWKKLGLGSLFDSLSAPVATMMKIGGDNAGV
jgi:hypothetical protein